MNFAPLLNTYLAVQIHVAAVVVAVAATAAIILYTKGTGAHKWLGRVFVAAMTLTAVSSFWIRELNRGEFSIIHVISVVTLLGLAGGVYAARQGNVRAHRTSMVSTVVGGLGVAGAFALLSPGRLLSAVFFG
ncbi:MAG: DUF2306 domain-containing protein [Gammaproteobacteria bacterium]|nr:DUF2306 domain-containing protein [Gammaproteobacteria bacterium]